MGAPSRQAVAERRDRPGGRWRALQEVNLRNYVVKLAAENFPHNQIEETVVALKSDFWPDMPRSEVQTIARQASTDLSSVLSIAQVYVGIVQGTHHNKPILGVDADGLAEAVRTAGWVTAWNLTSRMIMATRLCDVPAGEDDGHGWQEVTPGSLVLARLMEDVANTSCMQRTRAEPEMYRLSTALEWRLLLCVAARRGVRWGGSETYQCVMRWLEGLKGGGRTITISEALEESNALHKNWRGPGATRQAQADAKQAFIDFGCEYKSVRTPRGPRYTWTTPGPRVPVVLAAPGRLVRLNVRDHRVSWRLHFLGGWSQWEDRVDIHRRYGSERFGWCWSTSASMTRSGRPSGRLRPRSAVRRRRCGTGCGRWNGTPAGVRA